MKPRKMRIKGLRSKVSYKQKQAPKSLVGWDLENIQRE
jgi:hypothetical protein